ncbi:MAG: serine/threonine-protein kinase [Terriglobales bacterium]
MTTNKNSGTEQNAENKPAEPLPHKETMSNDDFIGKLSSSAGLAAPQAASPPEEALAPRDLNSEQMFALLSSNAGGLDHLSQSQAQESRTAPAANPDNQPRTRNALIGTKLGGRFEILEVLGQGGMSVVYKARQDVVDRFVAVKTLKLQLVDQPDVTQRFRREITSLCRLNHPHIVTVFDCIINDEGQPYIIMDYLQGAGLDQVLSEKKRLSTEQAQPLLMQICSALEHAHKQGIVHRDLKPSNIMLVGDSLEFVKVVDFGLSKLGQENQKITRSGEVWGSPPYMSPEQCRGLTCDGRSDIYALGVVMYEVLSGHDPFGGTDICNILLKQIGEPPPAFPPHLNIPQSWQQIIFKALAKDANERFQTMAELKDAIAETSKQSGAVSKTGALSQMQNAIADAAQDKTRYTSWSTKALWLLIVGLCAGSLVFWEKQHQITAVPRPHAPVVQPQDAQPDENDTDESSDESKTPSRPVQTTKPHPVAAVKPKPKEHHHQTAKAIKPVVHPHEPARSQAHETAKAHAPKPKPHSSNEGDRFHQLKMERSTSPN